MGKIRKILSSVFTEIKRLMARRLCVDLCENIHLHYRDLRLEFSVHEWMDFVDLITKADEHVRYQVTYGYEEGNHDLIGQYELQVEEQSDYFPGRIQLELQKNGTYHIHYNDLRIEMDEKLFQLFCEMFEEARNG